MGINLKYYYRYERKHGKAINPKIPLKQHYANEKALRLRADHLKDSIAQITHSAGFKIRALKREEIGIKNNAIKAKSEQKAINKISDQREMAIKQELNHDEKFRELYKQRLQKNTRKMKGALPDEIPSLQKLVNFDKTRIMHWKKTEDNYQKKLVSTLSKDEQDKVTSDKSVSSLEATIGGLQASIAAIKSRVGFNIARKQNELKNIEGTIANDIALDKKRAHKERAEAKQARADAEKMG